MRSSLRALASGSCSLTGTASTSSSTTPISLPLSLAQPFSSAAAAAAPLPPSPHPWSLLATAGGAAFAASSLLSSADAKEIAAAPAAPAAPAVDQRLPRGMTDTSDIVLYQYEVCPFCCKVRAVLDFYKLPYRVVEVDPMFKREVKWSTYRKVPIIMIDGEQINESSVIVDRLHNEMKAIRGKEAAGKGKGKGKAPAPGPLATAEDPAADATWRKWVDERFIPLVTINIYRTAGEALQTFDYITETGNFTWWTKMAAKYGGGAMMYYVSHRKMKAKFGVEGDERAALYAAVDQFTEALGSKPFIGGRTPAIADLTLFGVARAVRTTPTFRDMMAHAPGLAAWFARMEGAVGPSSRRFDEDKFMTK